MAGLITLPLKAPPDTIRVLVSYYDEAERIAFRKSMGEDVLGEMSRELTIPTTDFLTYFLYYKLRKGIAGFGSHDELTEPPARGR